MQIKKQYVKSEKINISYYRLKRKKKRLQENNRQWYNNQTPEKQQEMRIKARKYNKNRYDNMMVVVRE